jgi:hypothetical protein
MLRDSVRVTSVGLRALPAGRLASIRDLVWYAVITYYLWHPLEVEAYLEQRKAEAGEIRRQLGEFAPSQGFRERLLARRATES